jgi:ribonuclease D
LSKVPFELIKLGDGDSIIAALQSSGRIGIDTEFMREKTYFAELCLVQLSLDGRIFCADPLDATDLKPFWAALTECEWVLHSGRQDMEVIYQASGRMPTQLFDTQIAAALLGFAPQLGYAGLVLKLFDVTLDKSHTRADWSQRPLPDEVMRYAAEDVEYLLPAYDELSERLDKLDRRAWASQDSLDLLDRMHYDVDPSLAVDRVKGARNMRGAGRAAASRLAEWREREALRRNRPRQWILRDTVLLEIAQTRPSSMGALLAIRDLPERTATRAGDQILQAVNAATGDQDSYEPPLRPDERQKSILKTMRKLVADCAADLGIAAEIVAPNKELSAALTGQRDSRVFRGWRRELIGESLLAVLDRE